MIRILIPFVLALLLGFSGCIFLENTDELSTMGNYSREKDSQHRQVKSINDQYDALTKAIDQNAIGKYKDQASLVSAFGEPILKRALGDGSERWLYRHAIYRFAKDKVYVYFDRGGKLVKWEKLSCPKFF